MRFLPKVLRLTQKNILHVFDTWTHYSHEGCDACWYFHAILFALLQHDVEHYATWALLARDSWPYAYPAYVEERNKRNLYGVYPFLMALEKDYKAHGLLILNTNPQVVLLLLFPLSAVT